eukprot:CAMPEP_0204621646 /NCGR_PEP_ID=MMETSP0717-20131115/7296_1 /ASSEMBLY_ACC=CAM_ASM_000666 /TAXON_ID=230516 /ORGANISM="Chaetoceros curvisetus" /LENGTH=234 /DNA_ID=CAMNT_0051636103 /DNA_START=220 /DNA_END=924 /DNA_ORIENTATION=+
MHWMLSDSHAVLIENTCSIERAVFPISKFGQASILTIHQSSLLALRGGGTSSGIAVGGSIDILGVLMNRMGTLMQLAGVVYAIYLAMELKKQIDTMKDMVEKRVNEVKDMVEKKVNEVKEELETQWVEGWKRHGDAVAEVEKKVDKKVEEVKTQWDDGWKRHNEEVGKKVEEVKGVMKNQWDDGWKRQNKVIVENLEKLPTKFPFGSLRKCLIGIFSNEDFQASNEVDGLNDEE